MKSFADLRHVLEEQPFQDPPVVLNLRRTAIRMFPGKHSVAVYRNENLGIEVAIPYSPGDLGKVRIHVAGVSEEHENWINESLIHMEANNLDEATKEDEFRDYMRMSDSESQRTGGRHYDKRKAAGLYVRKKKTPAERIKYFADRDRRKLKEDISEAMSPELKKIKKERTMFKRDLARQEDRFEDSKTRLDWAKRALKGHVQKHGRSLATVGEAFVHTPEKLADYKAHPENRKKDQNAKYLKWFREKQKKNAIVKEETIMEASIHSLHAITKTQHPAQVRFKDGSSAMIDHPTAAQIMKLHSKVNRLNKKKIEGLINSGPSGIKKVSAFIRDHMK